jgi:hypothetical protein
MIAENGGSMAEQDSLRDLPERGMQRALRRPGSCLFSFDAAVSQA